MFYDMGSGSTTATIVMYQTVKTKESGTQPQLQIRGVGLVVVVMFSANLLATWPMYTVFKMHVYVYNTTVFLLIFRFDRTLGGFEMELRLRDHLAKLFNEQKKSKKDVRENLRAMAKLLKEAQRLKTVLSANAEHTAQVSQTQIIYLSGSKYSFISLQN